MYVTLLMDVEDLVAEEADDIAKTCAEILTHEQVKATLCVVGEKARLLRQRGRNDVIKALWAHDLGIHTDLHSVHPTIAEYLGDKDWERGVAEAIRREAPGVAAIKEVFGYAPSCWGGPGNTWGPQICEAMWQLGVSSFVYAYTGIPEGGIHRFGKILAYPHGRSLNDGVYQDDAESQAQLDHLASLLAEDVASGRYWQEVFLGHPTRILHEEFWDAPNFANGVNPPRSEWKPARRKSQADLDRALRNFRESVRFIRSLPDIQLRTIREMNDMLIPAHYTPLTTSEQEAAWPQIEQKLRGMAGWPILPRDFDLSNIVRATHEQLPTLQRIQYP